MSRVAWKVPYISPLLFSRIFHTKKSTKIWNRNSIVPACFVNKSVYVYNGKTHLPVIVRADMIGHKFGEFSITKLLGYRPKKSKKNKKKGKQK